jgi:hypothetical protein
MPKKKAGKKKESPRPVLVSSNGGAPNGSDDAAQSAPAGDAPPSRKPSVDAPPPSAGPPSTRPKRELPPYLRVVK